MKGRVRTFWSNHSDSWHKSCYPVVRRACYSPQFLGFPTLPKKWKIHKNDSSKPTPSNPLQGLVLHHPSLRDVCTSADSETLTAAAQITKGLLQRSAVLGSPGRVERLSTVPNNWRLRLLPSASSSSFWAPKSNGVQRVLEKTHGWFGSFLGGELQEVEQRKIVTQEKCPSFFKKTSSLPSLGYRATTTPNIPPKPDYNEETLLETMNPIEISATGWWF